MPRDPAHSILVAVIVPAPNQSSNPITQKLDTAEKDQRTKFGNLDIHDVQS